jgi:hypothetical protein
MKYCLLIFLFLIKIIFPGAEFNDDLNNGSMMAQLGFMTQALGLLRTSGDVFSEGLKACRV